MRAAGGRRGLGSSRRRGVGHGKGRIGVRRGTGGDQNRLCSGIEAIVVGGRQVVSRGGLVWCRSGGED